MRSRLLQPHWADPFGPFGRVRPRRDRPPVRQVEPPVVQAVDVPVEREHHEEPASEGDELERAKARIERAAKLDVERQRHELLRDMIEVLDDLDRAVASADDSPVVDGVLLVRDRFLAKLHSYGVTRVNDKGARFDPERHEAVAVVTVDDPSRHDVVVDVQRSGYRIDGELLRPALVVVGRAL